MAEFGVKRRSGWGLRWQSLKGGESIRGVVLRVGLTPYPQIDTGGIKVRIMLEENLLEDREEERKRKERVFQ